MYKQIKKLREDKNLTQQQMADILHCSQRVYSNYERGERDLPTELLIALARFHKTTTDYILGLKDSK
jgi:transcriptional regulator with XRE-family HTH domain